MYSRDVLQLDFLELCNIGDDQRVRNMLKAHLVDVKYQHPINGWTALHWAARRGHTEICLLLLDCGFSREVKDKNGRTPWDVCSENNLTLREILRLESQQCEEVSDQRMPHAGNKRRSSETAGDDKFVPNYIRNPPFPYVTKASSFDYGTKPPSSPTTPNGYYSYGRRDSVNRTRFILVRTCCTDGKQAFKRVTLPGGSSLEQLKKMVEKSMRQGRVEAIMTLPDKILVEEDSQIAQFSDCQRVEVIYGDSEATPPPVEKQPINTRIITNGSMEKESEEAKPKEQMSTGSETPVTGGGDNFPITLVEPFPSDHPDSSNAAQDDNLSNEGSIPLEPVPSMDVTPVETEENNDVHSEVESAHKISLRKSIDSDPGDFVKIETTDNGSSDAGVVEVKQSSPPIVVSSTSKEEEEGKAEIAKLEEKVATKPEAKSEEEEEKKREPKPEEKAERKTEDKDKDDKSPAASLMTWIDENPAMVRCCAATAAVVGVAGIGYFVYARRIRSGGV